MPVIEAFKKTIALLEKLKYAGTIDDFALIGGLALSAWIKPRTTNDVDIVVSVSGGLSLQRLAGAIETLFQRRVHFQKGSQRTTIKEKLSFVFGQIEVDLIGTKGFDLAEEALRHAFNADVFGENVKIVSPEYLILLKLLPLSEQDAVDIRNLVKSADMKKVYALAEKHHLILKLKPLLSMKGPQTR